MLSIIAVRLNFSLVLVLLVAVCFSASSQAQTAPHPANGIWADSNSAAFSNAYAIISVDEQGKVSMTHYLEFNGVPMVEKGTGTCSNNTLSYDVWVTKGIPGWATKGYHTLTLSADGTTLRGEYKDGKGNSGPMVFKRLRP